MTKLVPLERSRVMLTLNMYASNIIITLYHAIIVGHWAILFARICHALDCRNGSVLHSQVTFH